MPSGTAPEPLAYVDAILCCSMIGGINVIVFKCISGNIERDSEHPQYHIYRLFS